MAFPREPDEPYRSDEQVRRRSRIDNDLQPDPELTEGPASSGRIIAYAIAALLIVGAVLYGIAHSTSTDNASTASPPANTAKNTPAPTSAPNAQPGTTTGTAPAPSAPAPTPAPQNNPAPAPSDSGSPNR